MIIITLSIIIIFSIRKQLWASTPASRGGASREQRLPTHTCAVWFPHSRLPSMPRQRRHALPYQWESHWTHVHTAKIHDSPRKEHGRIPVAYGELYSESCKVALENRYSQWVTWSTEKAMRYWLEASGILQREQNENLPGAFYTCTCKQANKTFQHQKGDLIERLKDYPGTDRWPHWEGDSQWAEGMGTGYPASCNQYWEGATVVWLLQLPYMVND